MLYVIPPMRAGTNRRIGNSPSNEVLRPVTVQTCVCDARRRLWRESRLSTTPAETPQPLNLLVVDPDRRVRHALAIFLDALPHVTVAAACATGAEAEALAARLRPDACLIDLHLPTIEEGLATASALAALGTRVIAVCTDVTVEAAAITAGAAAFLGKDRAAEALPSLLDAQR
ncbi:response regulator [Microbispora sp. NBC_01189]|uniref:response regulator n=1 Tax=unclassified Microbispora TaxID=2614687 RepID=UPI002E0E312E|nr:response regulator [Microbispora sp. NBC_01189]